MTQPQVTDAMIEAALKAVQDLHIARTREQKWEPANEVPDPSFRDIVVTAVDAALAHQDGEVVVGEVGQRLGLKDKNGKPLRCGQIVRYNLEGKHTKAEYWNPVYRIEYKAPSFVLKHIGGGKCGGSTDFKLRAGGRNGNLEILSTPPKQKDAQNG